MRILVYGAGVIGSVYAARLQNSGNEITLVSRGLRFNILSLKGLTIKNKDTSVGLNVHPVLIEEVSEEEKYDLAIIAVRKNQLPKVLLQLKNKANIAQFLFMLNNAEGFEKIFQYIPREKALIGFPGIAGRLKENATEYVLISEQHTVIGEIDGSRSTRLLSIRKLLRTAGFPTRVCRNMDAWLKTHAALITAIAATFYTHKEDNNRLIKQNLDIPMMIRAIQEGFRSLIQLNIPISPFKLKLLFLYLPTGFAESYWRKYLASKRGQWLFVHHSFAAGDEMNQLANEFKAFINHIIPTPNLDKLYSHIEEYSRKQITTEKIMT